MAGTKTGDFRELISPFLRSKIAAARAEFGEDSRAVEALTLQYVKSPLEDVMETGERRRHYESVVEMSFEGRVLRGVERLYRRTILIEPTTVCAAHCRWCLRGQYPVQTMDEDDIVHAARYFGAPVNRDDLNEVLVTGGDPLMSLPLLSLTLRSFREHAPNIKTVRIGTRVPFQDPRRINEDMLALFRTFPEFRFEVAVNVNHPVEFWPESVEALGKLKDAGIKLYNQHPLLRGVNDDLPTLIELYSLMREHSIEAHYLFHAIPLRGMRHHRTSIRRGLELATKLDSCGEFSGRAKPRFAVLSDIGKIVLFHGVIADTRDSDNSVLLRSGYNIHDRMRWNPSWHKPDSVVLANDGTMMTWYRDVDEEAVDPVQVNELLVRLNRSKA